MQPVSKNTFGKHERLHSKKRMELLFAEGRNLHAPPLKLVYLSATTELAVTAQAMFVVPKRLFKRAHDRNKIRRRMKEAYRLNKNNFYAALQSRNKKIVLAFLYTGKKSESYDVIRAAIAKLLGNF